MAAAVGSLAVFLAGEVESRPVGYMFRPSSRGLNWYGGRRPTIRGIAALALSSRDGCFGGVFA